jgi:hypothetical protein
MQNVEMRQPEAKSEADVDIDPKELLGKATQARQMRGGGRM